MYRILLPITLLLSLASGIFAQTPGLLVSTERYQEIPLLPTYSGTKYTEVPVKLSLKKYCPVPGNQRQTGACVGWAVGYGALTIQRAIQSRTTDQSQITQYANSAAFLYNQVRINKTDCNEGAYLEDALNLLKNTGDCLEKSFNYDKIDCQAQPNDAHQLEAQQYQVRDFAAVFALNEDPKNKIGKACKILATNTPIVVGVGVTKSFFEILPGSTTWNPDEAESLTGYHAMVLVGYNNVEKYFEFFNSFGASWGQNGFIRMSFDDFERLCRYAFVIVTAANQDAPFVQNKTVKPADELLPDEQHFLSGAFVFRQPVGFVTNESGDEIMYFEEIQTQHAETAPGFYTTAQSVFKVGDVFQLVAREIPQGRYLYVFSQSGDGQVNVHFPRVKDAVATAGFVLDKNVEVVIPSEESLLQLPTPGEDFLCMLYSHASIPDFEARIRRMEAKRGAFPDKVSEAFSDLLIGHSGLQYSHDKMSFTAIADPAKGRIAAALILRVQAE